MIFFLALLAISITLCRATIIPTCDFIFGSSIDPNDCYEALQYPYHAALWTRMSATKSILHNNSAIYDLNWQPLVDSPLASAIASNASATAHDIGLIKDNQIAHDSAIITRNRLSREAAADDLYGVFKLPMVSMHQSCAVGIDFSSPGLQLSHTSRERKLSAFRRIERVIETCVDSKEDPGRGGFASTPHDELVVLVTKPELMQDLPPYFGPSNIGLGQLVASRTDEHVA